MRSRQASLTRRPCAPSFAKPMERISRCHRDLTQTRTVMTGKGDTRPLVPNKIFLTPFPDPANFANRITTVRIPAGTRLFIGRVGPQRFPEFGQVLRGGGTQIFIPDKSALIFGPPRAFP